MSRQHYRDSGKIDSGQSKKQASLSIQVGDDLAKPPNLVKISASGYSDAANKLKEKTFLHSEGRPRLYLK